MEIGVLNADVRINLAKRAIEVKLIPRILNT